MTRYREAIERWLSATILLVLLTSIILISGWVFGLDEAGGYIGWPQWIEYGLVLFVTGQIGAILWASQWIRATKT